MLGAAERATLNSDAAPPRSRAEADRGEIMATLAGGIAHECSSVLLAASTYLSAIPSGSHGADPSLSKVNALIQQAQTLSTSLLELFASPDVPGPSVLPVGWWLPACVGRLAGMLPHRVSIGLQPIDGPLEVRVDPIALEQVLRVLITNAAEALGEDGEVLVSAARNGPCVEVRVCDRGPGIAPADRVRVFEPFFTTRKRQRRSGLGLAIASRLVAQADGSLTYEPNEPNGSIFIIRLRSAQEEAR